MPPDPEDDLGCPPYLRTGLTPCPLERTFESRAFLSDGSGRGQVGSRGVGGTRSGGTRRDNGVWVAMCRAAHCMGTGAAHRRIGVVVNRRWPCGKPASGKGPLQ